MKISYIAAAVCGILTFGGAAQAATATIFSEDFAGDLAAAGGSVLNYGGFAQFGATSGTVDLIASGTYGIACATTACVDLDGSTGDSALFASAPITFLAGVSYELTAFLSGNQRTAATETGTFGITGGILDLAYSLTGSAFQSLGGSFTVAADTVGTIFFQDAGNDNVGAVLDRVLLTETTPGVAPVPLPAAGLLLLGGLGGLALARRRRA